MIVRNIGDGSRNSMAQISQFVALPKKFSYAVTDNRALQSMPPQPLYIPALTKPFCVINATKLGLTVLALTWQRDVCSRFDEELRCPEP